MPVNLDKPHLWKNDVARSVDMYNDWFMHFAPAAFRQTRVRVTGEVESALATTGFLRTITPAMLRTHPAHVHLPADCRGQADWTGRGIEKSRQVHGRRAETSATHA